MQILRLPDNLDERQWLVIAIFGILAIQGAFLLLPGPFWDGWIYEVLFLRNDREAFMDPFIANGRPLGGWVLWKAMQTFGVVAGPKVLSSASLLGAALALYGALRTRELMPRAAAALIALVTVTVPATQTMLSSSALQFFLGFFCFYCGLFSITVAAQKEGLLRFVTYGLSILMGVASVMLAEGTLVLLPLYPLAWLITQEDWGVLERPDRKMLKTLMVHSAPIAAGLLALVLVFTYFPTSGGSEGAHSLQLGLFPLLRNAGLYFVALGASELPLIVVALWIYRRQAMAGFWRTRALAGGFAILLLGLIPYLLAGRWPAILGWGARTLLLSGLGIGFMAWALAAHAMRNIDARHMPAAVLALCIAAIACTLWRVPLWAARQVKDDAVRLGIAEQNIPAQITTLWVSDPNWVIAAPYRTYEWTALAQMATARRDLMALAKSEDEADAQSRAHRLVVQENRLVIPVPHTPCHADLYIGRLSWSWPATATAGLLLRASAPDAYKRWLQHRISITVEPRPNCPAVVRPAEVRNK